MAAALGWKCGSMTGCFPVLAVKRPLRWTTNTSCPILRTVPGPQTPLHCFRPSPACLSSPKPTMSPLHTLTHTHTRTRSHTHVHTRACPRPLTPKRVGPADRQPRLALRGEPAEPHPRLPNKVALARAGAVRHQGVAQHVTRLGRGIWGQRSGVGGRGGKGVRGALAVAWSLQRAAQLAP